MTGYDDIMDEHRPLSKHKAMSISDRAKIFSPFAALTGFEDAIDEKNRVKVVRTELSDEKKAELDEKIKKVGYLLGRGEHPMVSVIYYDKDRETKEDLQIKKNGMVARLDNEQRFIQIVNEKIDFEDLCEVTGEMF